jgi:uncharacterized membrane protein
MNKKTGLGTSGIFRLGYYFLFLLVLYFIFGIEVGGIFGIIGLYLLMELIVYLFKRNAV